MRTILAIQIITGGADGIAFIVQPSVSRIALQALRGARSKATLASQFTIGAIGSGCKGFRRADRQTLEFIPKQRT